MKFKYQMTTYRVKKREYQRGEYITPYNVGVAKGETRMPEVRIWQTVALPLCEGYRIVVRKRSHTKGADNRNRCGVVDAFGRVIIPMEYEDIYPCSESTFTVYRNGQWAVKDIDDNYIIPFGIYDCIGSMSEGIISVHLNGKVGFVDRFNRVEIDFQYDTCRHHYWMPSFHKGYCPVKLDGKYGVIDHYNNLIIPFQWDYIQVMCGNRFVVGNYIENDFYPHEEGVINHRGEWILPIAPRIIISIEENLWRELDIMQPICSFMTANGAVPVEDRNPVDYWRYVFEQMEIKNDFSLDKLMEGVGELQAYKELADKVNESGICDKLDLDISYGL